MTINSLFSPPPVCRKKFQVWTWKGPRAATCICFGSVLLQARRAFDCQQPDGQRVCRVINWSNFSPWQFLQARNLCRWLHRWNTIHSCVEDHILRAIWLKVSFGIVLQTKWMIDSCCHRLLLKRNLPLTALHLTWEALRLRPGLWINLCQRRELLLSSNVAIPLQARNQFW